MSTTIDYGRLLICYKKPRSFYEGECVTAVSALWIMCELISLGHYVPVLGLLWGQSLTGQWRVSYVITWWSFLKLKIYGFKHFCAHTLFHWNCISAILSEVFKCETSQENCNETKEATDVS